MMPNFSPCKDERYPDYTLIPTDEPVGAVWRKNHLRVVISLTAEEADRFQNVRKAYDEWMEIIGDREHAEIKKYGPLF